MSDRPIPNVMTGARALKSDIADALERGLKGDDWTTQRVDYRTLLVKVATDDGLPRYFEVQVREMS